MKITMKVLVVEMAEIDERFEALRADMEAKFQSLVSKLDRALTIVGQTSELEVRIKMTLDDILSDVQAEKTQIDSLAALTAGIKKQLDDALAGTTLPPAVQAKIDAVFAGVETNKQAVVDAINANTTPPTP